MYCFNSAICLVNGYILMSEAGVHATDMPKFRGGTSESSSSYLFEGSSVSKQSSL